ncbi:hypothetical protein C4D60_Mb00t12650 [Musa balbisiana]|uniref:Uncharacterized protein n=1 Tax=Musa balbisiana TaxID=52838 RepID=A0A4S8I276_MUSBA|nr:hypothetical protein C4D60_Mb00t12650 [Musa balbisiana]
MEKEPRGAHDFISIYYRLALALGIRFLQYCPSLPYRLFLLWNNHKTFGYDIQCVISAFNVYSENLIFFHYSTISFTKFNVSRFIPTFICFDATTRFYCNSSLLVVYWLHFFMNGLSNAVAYCHEKLKETSEKSEKSEKS